MGANVDMCWSHKRATTAGLTTRKDVDMPQDYTIHDITSRNVTTFLSNGKYVVVTRVSIFVGDQGPFTQDFGPGTQYNDTPEAINQWQQNTKLKVMSIAAEK